MICFFSDFISCCCSANDLEFKHSTRWYAVDAINEKHQIMKQKKKLGKNVREIIYNVISTFLLKLKY